jgi:hypothetical protein
MTSNDFDRTAQAWLEDGPTNVSDRVLQAALDEVHLTRQRRAWWPTRRFREMNNTSRFAVAAAAVVVVAVAGISLLPGRGGIGGQGPSTAPTPTASPSPISPPSSSPLPAALLSGPLPPGRYSTFPLDRPNGGMRFTFTVGEGWQGFVPIGAYKYDDRPPADRIGVNFSQVNGLYSDPCLGAATEDVAVGPTVDDLATALGHQSAYEASTPVDVTLAGYSGKYVDLELPSDWVTEGCFLWGDSFYAQGPDSRWHLWILNVDGVRVVVLAWDFAGTPPEDKAELQAVVDSIQIEP